MTKDEAIEKMKEKGADDAAQSARTRKHDGRHGDNRGGKQSAGLRRDEGLQRMSCGNAGS